MSKPNASSVSAGTTGDFPVGTMLASSRQSTSPPTSLNSSSLSGASTNTMSAPALAEGRPRGLFSGRPLVGEQPAIDFPADELEFVLALRRLDEHDVGAGLGVGPSA